MATEGLGPDDLAGAAALPSGFEEQLELAYGKARLGDLWSHERLTALAACQAVTEALSARYSMLSPLAIGGGGITLLIHDQHFEKKAVVKVARPVIGNEERMNSLLHDEAEKLAQADHANVIRISDTATVVDENGRNVHYYVMDYIEGARDAIDYVCDEPSEERVMDVLQGALLGLEYLHTVLGLVHTDIKPSNVFCSSAGAIVVADFGFAKKLGNEGMTKNVGGTTEFMHPFLAQYIDSLTTSRKDVAEANRTAAREYPRNELDPIWDVYSLGVTLLYFISVLDFYRPEGVQKYERRYLRLMAYRMLDAQIGFARSRNIHVKYPAESGDRIPINIPESILGLPPSVLGDLKYDNVTDVLNDLRKLRGERNLVASIPELSRHLQTVVNAASHGPVPFSPRVSKLVNTPEVRALGNLPQLGLVRFVYPTASHSRLEHTLGAFAMACRLIGALYEDPVNPLFKQIMTEDDLKTGIVTALLHDVGHYPLAHDLEEVSQKVFSHEDRTIKILSESSEIRRVLAGEWGIAPERVTDVLRGEKDGAERLKNQILRSLIDGPIDADKIDYVLRDSENLRLPYGAGADFEKLLQSVTVVVTEDFQRKTYGQIGIQENGRTAAESLAFARYALYGVSYWHRTHRTAKAMLNRVAYGVLEGAYEKKGKENYTKAVRAELDKVLGSENEPKLPLEPRLFGTSLYTDAGSEAMMRWLQARADPGSQHLIDSLLERQLMKRVLVCSQTRDDSRIDWQAVRNVFGEIGANWRERLAISRDVSLAVAQSLAEWDENERTPGSQATVSDAAAFAADVHTAKALMIVDFPPLKKGSSGGFRFLREAEWSEGVVDPFRVDSLDESPVWRAVTESGYQAVGKLRVFCEPRFAPVISQALPRERFELLVNEVIRAHSG